jgi:sepiapterin reductase
MLLVVTGASQGFGQAVAVAFAKAYKDDELVLRVLLVARSLEALEETKDMMLQEKPSTSASLHIMDLSNLDTVESDVEELVQTASPLDQYDRIVIINNAGSLGHLGKVANSTFSDLRRAIDLNVTSSLWFTTRWSQLLVTNPNATLVNVSSLCAIESFPTMTTYCAGKAARDMYHASLAKEEPLLRVLNYAPGAMATKMTDILVAEDKLVDSIKSYFRDAHAKGAFIDPHKSAAKLAKLVLSGNYESGSHVDYWDLAE